MKRPRPVRTAEGAERKVSYTMAQILPFPAPRQGPRDPLSGIDGRALLDRVAEALAWVYCGGRYDTPRAVLAAHALERLPPDNPERDAARAELALFLAVMTPAERQGLYRQSGQIEALRNRQRRAERARRRAAP